MTLKRGSYVRPPLLSWTPPSDSESDSDLSGSDSPAPEEEIASPTPTEKKKGGFEPPRPLAKTKKILTEKKKRCSDSFAPTVKKKTKKGVGSGSPAPRVSRRSSRVAIALSRSEQLARAEVESQQAASEAAKTKTSQETEAEKTKKRREARRDARMAKGLRVSGGLLACSTDCYRCAGLYRKVGNKELCTLTCRNGWVDAPRVGDVIQITEIMKKNKKAQGGEFQLHAIERTTIGKSKRVAYKFHARRVSSNTPIV
jgi:hypothetical protein